MHRLGLVARAGPGQESGLQAARRDRYAVEKVADGASGADRLRTPGAGAQLVGDHRDAPCIGGAWQAGSASAEGANITRASAGRGSDVSGQRQSGARPAPVGEDCSARARRTRPASSTISRTISPAGWRLVTSPTPCP